MFIYYLVTGIITLALIALCAFAMFDKTKAQKLINELQEKLDEMEQKLFKSEKRLSESKERYEKSVEQFDEMRVQRDALKKSNRELENLVHNCNEVEKQMTEDLQFRANRIKTLENKIAKLKKELKAKEEVKAVEEVKEEIVPEVVKEEVKVEETKTEEAQPKKAKRPYKRSQKKQN